MTMELDRRYIDDGPTDVAVARAQAVAALDFAEETVREAQTSRKHAWVVTALLIVICAAQAAAIALMLPLKEIVPYTILVDRQSGYMETVRGVETGALKDDEAVVSSFLAQYVLQRETFDPADFNERYRRVALWSAEQARQDYIASYQPGPHSVMNGLRPGSTVSVRVKNIEVMSNNTARVRFDLTRRDPGLVAETTDWQTLVTFRFTGAPMRMQDRLVNPLGFQVTGYRRDAEFGPPQVAEAAQTAATPTASDAAPVEAAPLAAPVSATVVMPDPPPRATPQRASPQSPQSDVGAPRAAKAPGPPRTDVGPTP
jgi:type IV secretion system protein VirB8